MKKITVLLCLLLPMLACAKETDSAETAKSTETATSTLTDQAERNKMMYSLGYLSGNNVQRELEFTPEDYKPFSQGQRDSFLKKKPQIDVEAYKTAIMQEYQRSAQIVAQRRENEQKEYLANFQKEKGVKVLDNGAMMKLSRPGKGKSPKADGTATVHYTGTLIDGTQFDSSRGRNQPFTARLTNVIPCWTKALQQMKPGARAQVVCPSDTAYGNRPVGPIPPNSVLVFDIEVLDVK